MDNLGRKIYNEYQGDLPFLFKVLSIGGALSIQAHPDKVLAERLYKDFPKIYKDPNHKPGTLRDYDRNGYWFDSF